MRNIKYYMSALVALSFMGFGSISCTESSAQQISFTAGTFVDAADGNRFFTRLGGTAEDELTYAGLETGVEYTFISRLINVQSGVKGDPVTTNFTPTATTGTVTVEFEVPPNKTEFNIDYVNEHTLLRGSTELGTITGDSSDPTRTIQVHAIQRISIISVTDAQDGDQRLAGTGGEILVKVKYENMVEGYEYTFWGQLLTQSGQAIGNFASIAHYAPVGKSGEIELRFTVPNGYEGLSLTPSVGVYHKNRVTLAANGYLNWNEGAPNPVMIASDTDLDNPAKTVEVGVPFGQE